MLISLGVTALASVVELCLAYRCFFKFEVEFCVADHYLAPRNIVLCYNLSNKLCCTHAKPWLYSCTGQRTGCITNVLFGKFPLTDLGLAHCITNKMVEHQLGSVCKLLSYPSPCKMNQTFLLTRCVYRRLHN